MACVDVCVLDVYGRCVWMVFVDGVRECVHELCMWMTCVLTVFVDDMCG